MTLWRRLHRATRWAAALGALLALVVLGPFVVAALMLRSSSDARGPEPMAYVVLGALLLLLMATAAAVAGLLAAGVRRLLGR